MLESSREVGGTLSLAEGTARAKTPEASTECSRSWRHAKKAGASRERGRLTDRRSVGRKQVIRRDLLLRVGKKPLKDFLGGGGRKAGLHLNLGELEEQGFPWSGWVGRLVLKS